MDQIEIERGPLEEVRIPVAREEAQRLRHDELFVRAAEWMRQAELDAPQPQREAQPDDDREQERADGHAATHERTSIIAHQMAAG